MQNAGQEEYADFQGELVDMLEVRRLLEEGMQNPPTQTKLIYQLSRSGGMKPLEIADELGLSIQTVRNTLVRAIKLIKEQLEQEGVTLPLLIITLALT